MVISGIKYIFKDSVKSRNIRLGYWLIALHNAFFWFAPWLLFIYRYVDIRQATILTMIALVTQTLAEIPTGALADLIGKKKTLMIAFLITTLAEGGMAFADTFGEFAVFFVFISLGYSFYSGTMDAFMYDSLVDEGKKDLYPEVLSKSNAYMGISTAVATLAGGYLFQFWGGLPFLVTGLAKFVGLVVTFLIVEPRVDTFVFSYKNFVKQTSLGFSYLFNRRMIKVSLVLILMGSFSTIAYEILDDVAVVDWGYSATGISILYTVALLLSIPLGFFYKQISEKINPIYLVVGGIFFLVLNYLFSPLINVTVWTGLFLIRDIFSPIRKAAITDLINRGVASNIRATTLSTYELVVRIPFVIFGVVIGSTMKDMGVRGFSVIFSLILITLLAIYWLYRVLTSKRL